MKLPLISALLLSVAAQAAAQLPDPTRPPAAPAGAGSASVIAAPAPPRLQSVLISREPGGRRVAVIDGQTVRLGGTLKGAVLSRISPGEVELTRGKQREVLKLAPARQPQPASANAAIN